MNLRLLTRASFCTKNTPLPIQRSLKLDSNIQEFKQKYSEISSSEEISDNVSLAGRIIGIRKANKNIHFLDLSSNGTKVQAKIDKRVSEGILGKDLDRGDIISLQGNPGRTRAGELSLIATNCALLSKCHHNMPMMNYTHTQTLKDAELRFQKRYLDSICNPKVHELFLGRAKIIKSMRHFLESKGYLEVETPLLNSQASGALARPFKTRANELKADLELRIAPELYLKQLIIGGFEKVYEIGKVFRNEGIDTTHNPEFTTCEFYQAYADYETMMELTEEMLNYIVTDIFDTSKITIQKNTSKKEKQKDPQLIEIDFSKPFQRYDVLEEIENYCNEKIDLEDPDLRLKLEGLLYEAFPNKYQENMNEKQLFDKLIEGIIEPKCTQPSYIIHHPSIMSPLAKTSERNPLISERFELFINSMEVINAYTEENDHQAQSASFAKQKELQESHSDDDEILQTDDSYLKAMSYGMPPTGGCGIGIDRLCMLLFNQASIREVILFPMFRSSVLKPTK
ncbi:unnamed protein product [Moneuplotes crassus]|uniref:Lysine--tRNA ligase n=1 Tax=Euplotes crassus TaxID=5936 RepID=A0AAD1UI76_EUPCR|nr:unnamed protein product [Moneuplotes crassus]